MNASRLRSLSTVLSIATLATTLFSHVSAGDWPGFLGPDRDGKSAETGLDLDWPASGPPLAWHVATGEGYAMASIAEGRVFVFDRIGDRERLRALDADTGEPLWTADAPVSYEDAFGFSNGPRTSPLVDGERVFTFGVTGQLRAYAVSDGKPLWSVDTSQRYGVIPNFFGVGSNPIVHDGKLIVMVGGSPPNSPPLNSGASTSNGSALVAFDPGSGKELWRSGEDLASYSSPVVARIGDAWRGFVLARAGLLAFDPSNGKTLATLPWRAKKLYSVNAATPVVAGDVVFLTESYQKGGIALKVKGSKVEPIWQDGRREQALASHWSTPVHHDGWLYGSHGESSGSAELRAVKLSDGTVGWKQGGLGRSTQILVEDQLIVLSEDGRLLVVDTNPEKFVARSDVTPKLPGSDRPLLEAPAWNAPALADGRLYVAGEGRLAAFDLRGKAAATPATPSPKPAGQ